MQYGYFDDAHKEYDYNAQDALPWINYLNAGVLRFINTSASRFIKMPTEASHLLSLQ